MSLLTNVNECNNYMEFMRHALNKFFMEIQITIEKIIPNYYN